MGLLWVFMDASVPYTVFCGAAELVAGVLLFFPRTTTLGSLVSIGVMSNVVAINFSYALPVKLLSVHLPALAVFLAAADARRLTNLLVPNRAAEPARMATVLQRPAIRRVAYVLKIVLLTGVTGTSFVASLSARSWSPCSWGLVWGSMDSRRSRSGLGRHLSAGRSLRCAPGPFRPAHDCPTTRLGVGISLNAARDVQLQRLGLQAREPRGGAGGEKARAQRETRREGHAPNTESGSPKLGWMQARNGAARQPRGGVTSEPGRGAGCSSEHVRITGGRWATGGLPRHPGTRGSALG